MISGISNSSLQGSPAGVLLGVLSMLWYTFWRSYTAKKRLLLKDKRRFFFIIFACGALYCAEGANSTIQPKNLF